MADNVNPVNQNPINTNNATYDKQGRPGWTLFGFQIKRAGEDRVNTFGGADGANTTNLKSFSPPQNDDGAVTIASGSHSSTYVDFEGVVRNEIELITRYREMAMQPEMERAIEDIVNEAIVIDNETGKSVDINLDKTDLDTETKKKIIQEFENVCRLLDFGNMGHDIFKRWYIDGRVFYHLIIDNDNIANGIQEIRYIDPRRIRKIREIQKAKDPRSGIEIIKNMQEYYLYNERGVIGAHTNLGARIAPDSVVNVNSGLMDSRRAMVLSYLHKAIKPLNQLRMMEDAVVVYKVSRAPDRRVFYIDVGNLPKMKAEQYMRDIMVKYRNKLVYDSSTGEISDSRKFLSMLEDFWLPRREGSRGTEIDTLPGGESFDNMNAVEYFQKKLYEALNIPMSRLMQSQPFNIGRPAEISRDELNFTKFIQRMRNKFSTIFDDVMKIQLVLKGICTLDEWKLLKEQIAYDFQKDNDFNELKNAEILRERLATLQQMDMFVGHYFSRDWVKKHVLYMNDEEIEQMQEQIEKEKQEMGLDDLTVAGAMAASQQEDQMELMAAQGDLLEKQLPLEQQKTATAQASSAKQPAGKSGGGKGAKGKEPPEVRKEKNTNKKNADYKMRSLRMENSLNNNSKLISETLKKAVMESFYNSKKDKELIDE